VRLNTLNWNDHTFKQLTKEAKLIYCFLEANCSTAGFLQADESDIAANGIGLERRTGLNPVCRQIKVDFFRYKLSEC